MLDFTGYSRKKRLLTNTVMAGVVQLVSLVSGFILPRFFLVYYGSAVNGLVASITNFLGFITLCECGVGAVVQSALYKPLADGDEAEISRVATSSARFFKNVAYILIAYTVVLFAVYPLSVRDEFDFFFSGSLVFIIAISSFAQYYFGITYRLLLDTDQLNFIQMGIQCVSVLLNLAVAVVAIKLGAGVHIVKLISSTIFLIQPFFLKWYVDRHYNLNLKVKLTDEPIKQKWNGLAQHIAAIVLGNTPSVVLTLFSTLASVSVYNIYYMVVNGIRRAIIALSTGFQSTLGNMLAKGETETLNRTFNAIEWGLHTLVTLIFTVTAITIVPFVSVYTRGITDADYFQPLFAVLLVLGEAMHCFQLPYKTMVMAAGHFKETQTSSFIEAGLNIVASVALVFPLGVSGVALGTIAAILYRTVYLNWYLTGNILNRRPRYVICQFLSDIATAALIWSATFWIDSTATDYLQWAFYAAKVFVIGAAVSVTFNLLVFRKELRDCMALLSRKNS